MDFVYFFKEIIMLGIAIGCATLVVVGWAILRGKYAPLVLFASGAFMLLCAASLT